MGIRLLTRNGHDWASRYPLIVEAVNHLRVRSVLIDGEVVCCDDRGLATFQLLRLRWNEPKAFLYAFDLLELDGTDMRREPIEVGRQRWRASCARRVTVCALTSTWSIRMGLPCSSTRAEWAWRGSCRSDSALATDRDARRTG